MNALKRSLALAPLALGLLALCHVAYGVADQQQDEDQGKLIQIGPEGPGDRGGRFTQPGFPDANPVAVSRYWIGVHGGPLTPALKAHVVLPDSEGVLVRSVESNSPAAEAGVQTYDILTRVDGKPLNSIGQLAEAVGEQGELKGRMAIELTRGGRTETVWVTPEERPVRANPLVPFQRFGVQPGLNLQQMRGGVSITMQRQGNGPAQITVRKGDQTWQVIEGDEASLAALPDDVRPQVEQLLQRQNRLGEGIRFNAGDIFPQDMPDPFEMREQFRRAQEDFQREMDAIPFEGNAAQEPEAPQEEQGEPMDIEIPAE